MDYEKLSISGTMSARIPSDLANMVNDNIHNFIPDDVPENELQKKHVVIEIIKTALAKSVSKKELEKLTTENAEYKAAQEQNLRVIAKLEAEADGVEIEFKKLQKENAALSESLKKRGGKIKQFAQRNLDLSDELERTSEAAFELEEKNNDVRLVKIHLTKAEFIVTEAFRKKLSEKVGEEITIGQMLFDLFWKYVTKQATRIAFPFFLSKRQIKKMIDDAGVE